MGKIYVIKLGRNIYFQVHFVASSKKRRGGQGQSFLLLPSLQNSSIILEGFSYDVCTGSVVLHVNEVESLPHLLSLRLLTKLLLPPLQMPSDLLQRDQWQDAACKRHAGGLAHIRQGGGAG